MRTELINLQHEIAELEAELADIYSMSEEACQYRYNVDCKEEAIEPIEEDLQILYTKCEEIEALLEVKIELPDDYPIFPSREDCWAVYP